MSPTRLTAEQAASFFSIDQAKNVFPLFAAHVSPEAAAGVAYGSGSKPELVLMKSGACETETVHDNYLWISPESSQGAFDALVLDDAPLYFDTEYTHHLQRRFGRYVDFKFERIYVKDRDGSEVGKENDRRRPQQLTAELLARISVPDEFLDLVGTPKNFPKTDRFFCDIIDDELVAVAEAIVQTPHASALEQVYVAKKYRRLGYARQLVGAAADQILREGRMVVYRVQDENRASIQLVESLGFRLHSLVSLMSRMD